jgi:hypothetical protein
MNEQTNLDMQNEKPDTVAVVFGFVQPMYDMLERRYVAMEARIQQVLGLSIAVSLAVIAFLSARNQSLEVSIPIILAFIVQGLLILIRMITIGLGRIKAFGIEYAMNYGLTMTEEEFKRKALGWAVCDIKRNVKLIDNKGTIPLIMVGLLIIQAIFLLWRLFKHF